MRRVTSLVTSALVAIALLGLAGTTSAAVAAIARANDRVTSTRETVAQFALLREALSEEAFAEAGYRRAESDEAWQRLEAATAAMPALIREVRAKVPASDGITLSQFGVLNARYVRQIRAIRDAPGGNAEDRVAGPALDAMRTLLEATISRHREEVTKATVEQADLIQRLRLLLPAAFAIAFLILVWVFRLDLRERRRLRAESASNKQQALTDALTGLPNRAALLSTMRAELQRPTAESAVLFLDLDRFKPINDTWGHHAGDAVLQEVGRRLKDAVRAGDLAARLGGDEFAVFLPRDSDAEGVEQRILDAFDLPFDVEGRSVEVRTSIGTARSRDVGRNTEDLLRAADEALYRSKRSRCA